MGDYEDDDLGRDPAGPGMGCALGVLLGGLFWFGAILGAVYLYDTWGL